MSNDKRERLEGAIRRRNRCGIPIICDTCPDYKYCSHIDSDLWADQYNFCMIGNSLKKRKIKSIYVDPPLKEAIVKKEVTIDGMQYVPVSELGAGEVIKIKKVAAIYSSGTDKIQLEFDRPQTYFRPGDTVRIEIVERGKG